MKTPLASIAALCLFLAANTQAQQSVKIFILAGQSNMLGHGEMSPVTTSGTLEYITANDPEGKYQFLKNGPNWTIRTDVLIRDQNAKTGGLTAGYGAFSTTIGPELGFGHTVGDALENPVLLVKCAWGGKSLGFDFCPPSSRIGAPAPVADGDRGFYYTEILRLVSEATTNLATYVPGYTGQGYEIAGFAWHQGWNDRVDGPMSAAYEVNMANFINDIRADLARPNLPFVIATTGMDGKQGHGYTQVERAQLKMAAPIAYPAFVGNVAVIDARATYENLDFWQPTPFSPSPGGSQGFHWNRSAKTYLHLGLAMGDAMNLIAPGRAPYRLRSTGGSGGTILNWKNGTVTPTSVRVLRNGSEIAAAAPANPPTFTDAAAPPGTHTYELQFTMPGDPAAPLTITHSTGVADLTASYRSNGMRLTWQNHLAYTGIEVRRDGTLLATLPGSATTFTDPAPPTGPNTYTVTPTDPGSPASEVAITVTAAPRGTATFYEPFDMPSGVPLAGQPAGIGIDALWHSDIGVTTSSGSFSFGTLPTFSNRTTRSADSGAATLFMDNLLQDAGLISPGSELWFSFLTTNPNNSNVSPIFVIGNEAPTNSSTIGNSGSAIGVRLNQGTQVQPMIYNNGSAVATGTTQHTLTANETVLVVGRIQWAATPGANTTISVYTPASGTLTLDTPTSVSAAIDPANFRILSLWGNQTAPAMDEIRFGTTYEDVIGAGADTSSDLTAPTPAVMAFDTPPTPVSETSITMTATTALDDNGVQYRFHNLTLDTYSLWQESRIFTATNLIPGIEYSFSVQARDKSVNQNTNTAATPVATSTLPPDLTPPPTPAFATPPAGLSTTAITMTATTVADPEGTAVEYRFNNLTLSTNSGWQSSPNFIATGLEPATTYTFTVQARDSSFTRNESAPSASANASTFAVTTASGTWNVNAGGDWSNALNWLDTTVANGSGSTATIAMTTNGARTIAVDSARTIGNITRNWPQNSELTIAGPSLLTLEVLNGTPTLTNNDLGGARRMKIDAPLASTQGLAIAGGGLVWINNTTTNYTGPTTIQSGAWLDFGALANNNIGGGPAAGRNITVQPGGTVRFSALSNTLLNRLVETTEEITVMTGGTSNALNFATSTGANLPNAFLGNWSNNGGKTDYNGSFTPASDFYRFGSPNSSGLLTIATNLSGTQGVIIGGNRVQLSGINTHSGTTTVRNGARLVLARSTAMQNSPLDTGTPSSTGLLTLSNGTGGGGAAGTNAQATPNPILGGLIGSRNLSSMINQGTATASADANASNNTGTLALNSITGITLNPGEGRSFTYTGSIGNITGSTTALTLTKTGPGTQTLTGTNSYTGTTSVNQGTLALVGGSQQSPILVAPGASLGFTLGSPTSSVSSVDLTTGTVKITGSVDNASDYRLITANGGITGTLALDGEIPNYELQLRDSGKQLWLAYIAPPTSPYADWSNGAPFDGDSNNDGVSNGLAFLLGAANPNANAHALLPQPVKTAGGLQLSFSIRNAATRGTAAANVQWSSDLGLTDSWASNTAAIPETSQTLNGVSFQITPDGTLNHIIATIPSSDATLFGRVSAQEN